MKASYDILPEIQNCDLCGQYYDELVIARLVLTSGQIIEKYLCESCLLKVRSITKK
jgi:hypothetical protein